MMLARAHNLDTVPLNYVFFFIPYQTRQVELDQVCRPVRVSGFLVSFMVVLVHGNRRA